MAEVPSSEALSLPERLELEGEKPLPPPASSASAAAAAAAVVARPKSESTPSSPVTCAPGSSPDPAASSPSSPSSPGKGVEVEVSAPETLAVPAAAADNSSASSDGGGDDSGERRSSSKRLPAAAAPALVNSSAATPVVSVPVDAVRLPVVAVPCFIAPAALLEPSGFPFDSQSQFAMAQQAVLATVTAQAQMQLQTGYAAPISPAPASEEKPPAASQEGDREQRSDQKTESVQNAPMKSSGDGFNWRKYGQKQVKGSESSRSYYKCTYASCSAKKKVEHRQDGHVLEVIYRGGHNHHPPQKARFSKERRSLPGAPSADHESSAPANGKAGRAEPSPLKADPNADGDGGLKRVHCSSDCEADADVKARGSLGEEPDLKRRLLERPKASPSPVFKTVKEPKIIRQTTSESGSLSDGYRWRKYGQKIVKGNPNPRSYYRCTQLGCPARKHVEKDSTDERAVIINYEGKHNHDLPPPKTATAAAGHPPPAADLLVAAAAAIEAGDRAARPASPGTAGSGAGDGSLESAQTLLSIGFGPAAEGTTGGEAGTAAPPGRCLTSTGRGRRSPFRIPEELVEASPSLPTAPTEDAPFSMYSPFRGSIRVCTPSEIPSLVALLMESGGTTVSW